VFSKVLFISPQRRKVHKAAQRAPPHSSFSPLTLSETTACTTMIRSMEGVSLRVKGEKEWIGGYRFAGLE
jgi:hypothetical protein